MQYEVITPEDIDEIIRVQETYLTKGKQIGDEIRKACEDRIFYGLKLVDEESCEMLGFVSFTEGPSFTLPKPELEDHIREIAKDGRFFTGDCIYLSADLRGGGLGSELMAKGIEYIRSIGGRYCLGELWIYPDGITPAGHPLENTGYKEIFRKVYENFYTDLPKYGMSCPICGERCVCGADVRLIDLKTRK